jgi:5'(3')-deoxyribonucleotidase
MPKTEHRPTIAADLDDVVSNERHAVMHFANELHGLGLTEADFAVEGPYWSYWEHVLKRHVSEDKADQFNDLYKEAEVWRRHEPQAGAIEALGTLRESHDLAIVTSRGDLKGKATFEWLEQHFPDVFRKVEFVQLWGQRGDVTKAVICQALGAEWLIDDNPGHCALAAEAGVQGLLFGEYGWNRNVEIPKGVTRVRNWQEVLEYFDGEG